MAKKFQTPQKAVLIAVIELKGKKRSKKRAAFKMLKMVLEEK